MAKPSDIDITEIIKFVETQRDFDYEEVKQAVLFLGRTGTGKSTLTHFLSCSSEIRSVGRKGQYVMVDDDGFISDPATTILSKTIFPKPLECEGVFYMDCPGFRDTRSFSMEIVSTIFTKKALKDCKKVKVVFVISYEEVKTGGDRNAFIELVENASDFMIDLEKFSESIALFVSKVPNLTEVKHGKRELIPDSAMRQHVMDFLRTTLETVKDPANFSNGQKHIYKKAEKFIKILLENGGDDLRSRIGIFRVPDDEGYLSEMEISAHARGSLKSVINQLEWIDVCEDDFGYAITTGSKLCIMKAIEDSVQSVGEIITDMCEGAIQRWQDFERAEEDFQILSEHFTAVQSHWNKTYDQLQSVEITSDALVCLIEHAEVDDENSEMTDQLRNHVALIELMEMVSNEKYRISISKWTTTFRKAVEVVNAANDWYGRVPILIVVFKYASQIKGPGEVRGFMQKLDLWIEEGDPVRGHVFRTALSQVAKEFSVVSMDYYISTIKIERLNNLCKAGKLDKIALEPGFWGGFKRALGTIVLANTNVMLCLVSGKNGFQKDMFSEVRKICHMND